MSHKIFDNNLVAISKRKLTLKLNRAAYIDVCMQMHILKLSKVLTIMITLKVNMAINQNYYLQTLIDEIKTEDVYEDFSNNKEMLDFSNYSTKSKYMMIQTN